MRHVSDQCLHPDLTTSPWSLLSQSQSPLDLIDQPTAFLLLVNMRLVTRSAPADVVAFLLLDPHRRLRNHIRVMGCVGTSDGHSTDVALATTAG
jgi:hypothetical protein